MMVSIVIAAGALSLLQAVIVAGVAALRPKGNIYVAIIAVSFITAPLVFLGSSLLFPRGLSVDGRVYLTIVHLALGGFLFHFMTLPDRSVTLRILVEILLVPSQMLKIDDLRQRYSVRSMIESRLVQLSAGNFIDITPDRSIVLKTRGVWFGRFVTGGRELFKIKSAN